MRSVAAAANVWDNLLYKEARELVALDDKFFGHAAVAAALAGGGGGGGHTPVKLVGGGGAVGGGAAGGSAVGGGASTVASCGYLGDSLIWGGGGSQASEGTAPPLCWEGRLLHRCCWHSGGAASDAAGATARLLAKPRPQPPLPLPEACILPPAGTKSTAT